MSQNVSSIFRGELESNYRPPSIVFPSVALPKLFLHLTQWHHGSMGWELRL